MRTLDALDKNRDRLLEMAGELQGNDIILEELEHCYGVFRFTGGVVYLRPWGLAAVTSYLQCPFAADRLSTAAAERYRHLAVSIMDLGREIATGARPRTLRCRWDIADRFHRDSAEIRPLAIALELALATLTQELNPDSPGPELDGIGPGCSTNAMLATTQESDE